MKKFTKPKVIILSLICILSFLGAYFVAFAADNSSVIAYYNISHINNDGKLNFDCKVTGEPFLSLTATEFGYDVKYLNIVPDGTTSNVTCSYQTIGGESLTETYSYKAANVISFGAHKHSNLIPLLPEGVDIKGARVTKGNEYIDLVCPASKASQAGRSCVAKETEAAKQASLNGIDYLAVVELDLEKDGIGITATASVTGDPIYNKTRAYPGKIGECKFGSEWKHQTWKDASGTVYSFMESDGGTLPTCDSSYSKFPVKFRGWVIGDTDNPVPAVGNCNAVISPNTKGAIGTSYYACYELGNYIQVATDGNLQLTDGWETAPNNNGYLYSSDTETSVALPEVKFVGFNEKKKLTGYKSSKDGSIKKPGDVVPLDGTLYQAIVEFSYPANKDTSKYVYVNQTVALVVDGATACNGGSGNLKASWVNGECQVTGLSATDTPTDVVVALEGGRKTVYKFTVKDNQGQNGNGDFIVESPAEILQNMKDKVSGTGQSSEGISTGSCNSFFVSGSHGFVAYTSRTVVNNGKTLPKYRGANYDVKKDPNDPVCMSDSSEYTAFCLDPGRRGPGESGIGTIHYVRATDLSANDSELARLVNYIVKQTPSWKSDFQNTSNGNRIAAHVAIRSVAIKSGVAAATSPEDTYYAQYQDYAEMASYIGSPELGNFINSCGFLNGSGPKLLDYLTGYNSAAKPDPADPSKPDKKDSSGFSREIIKKDVTSNGNSYTINYEFKITAPEGVTVTGLKGWSYGGASGSAGTLVSSDGNTYTFTASITVNDAASVKVPTNKQEQKNFSFTLETSGNEAVSEMFIAEPDNHAKLQRMFMFNTGESKVMVYLPITPDCTLPALDPSKCNDKGCSADFNEDLFKETGCCGEVYNETAQSYLANEVCAKNCVVSTLTNACEYRSNGANRSDLYIIKEGARVSGGGYDDNIDACVANVTEDYNRGGNKKDFMMNDMKGNSLNVAEYGSNRYCQVTCREDWKISMESFGNYVGKKAVAAGTYFSTADSEIFIGGKRECFTSFLNLNAYKNDITVESNRMTMAYNDYALHSHIWTDANKSLGKNDTRIDRKPTRICIKTPTKCNQTHGKVTKEQLDDYFPTDHQGLSETPGELMCGYEDYSQPYYDCYSSDKDENGACKKGATYHPFCSSGSYDSTEKRCVTSSDERLCEKYALVFDFEVEEQNRVESGNYPYYGNSKYKPDGIEFQKDNVTKKHYDYVEKIQCKPIFHGIAQTPTLECNFSGDSYAPNGAYTGEMCESNTIENGFCGLSDRGQKNQTRDEMLEKVKDKAHNYIAAARGTMSGAKMLIHDYSKQLYQCQHFQLYNTTDDHKVYETSEGDKKAAPAILDTGSYLDHGSVPYVKIPTAFDPSVSYTYDEIQFMTIIGDDNILIPDMDKNDSIYGGPGSYLSATNDSKDAQLTIYESSGSDAKVGTTDVKLDRNKKERTTYNDKKIWKEKSSNAKKYEGNASSGMESTVITFCHVNASPDTFSPQFNGDEWIEGQNVRNCYTKKVEFPDSTYVKASLSNSSFYRNKGYWFNSIADIKEHGDSKVEALENANKRPGSTTHYETNKEELGRWTLLGGTLRKSGINVFPVSLSTPRNLYAYTYAFGQIGSTFDGQLGRLMGNDNSIIANNTRSCFYEVYEELCLCCGSPIDTEIHTPDVQDELDKIQGGGNVVKPPKGSQIIMNEDGSLSFSTTSFDLSNLSSSSNRVLGSNWSEKSPFLYSGVKYYTDKGSKLVNSIENKGQKVYLETPEYAYHLTPSTLSAIREYNDKNGYEILTDQLTPYGIYSIRNIGNCADINNCTWGSTDPTTMDNTTITFQHFGSKFLEEFMNDNAAGVSTNLATTSYTHKADCYVTSADLSNGSEASKKIAQKVHNGCRWVDYVQAANPQPGEPTDGPQYFRMSFK